MKGDEKQRKGSGEGEVCIRWSSTLFHIPFGSLGPSMQSIKPVVLRDPTTLTQF